MSPTSVQEVIKVCRHGFADILAEHQSMCAWNSSGNGSNQYLPHLTRRRCRLSYENGASKIREAWGEMEQHWNARAGQHEITDKTRRPTTSSGTIPTYGNPGVTRPGIEPSALYVEMSHMPGDCTIRPPSLIQANNEVPIILQVLAMRLMYYGGLHTPSPVVFLVQCLSDKDAVFRSFCLNIGRVLTYIRPRLTTIGDDSLCCGLSAHGSRPQLPAAALNSMILRADEISLSGLARSSPFSGIEFPGLTSKECSGLCPSLSQRDSRCRLGSPATPPQYAGDALAPTAGVAWLVALLDARAPSPIYDDRGLSDLDFMTLNDPENKNRDKIIKVSKHITLLTTTTILGADNFDINPITLNDLENRNSSDHDLDHMTLNDLDNQKLRNISQKSPSMRFTFRDLCMSNDATAPVEVGAASDVAISAEEVDGADKTGDVSLEKEIDGEKPLPGNIHSTLTRQSFSDDTGRGFMVFEVKDEPSHSQFIIAVWEHSEKSQIIAHPRINYTGANEYLYFLSVLPYREVESSIRRSAFDLGDHGAATCIIELQLTLQYFAVSITIAISTTIAITTPMVTIATLSTTMVTIATISTTIAIGTTTSTAISSTIAIRSHFRSVGVKRLTPASDVAMPSCDWSAAITWQLAEMAASLAAPTSTGEVASLHIGIQLLRLRNIQWNHRTFQLRYLEHQCQHFWGQWSLSKVKVKVTWIQGGGRVTSPHDDRSAPVPVPGAVASDFSISFYSDLVNFRCVGTVVVYLLDYSRTRFDFRQNHSRILAWDLQFPQSLHSDAAPYSPHDILIVSQDLDDKIRPDLSTPLHSTLLWSLRYHSVGTKKNLAGGVITVREACRRRSSGGRLANLAAGRPTSAKTTGISLAERRRPTNLPPPLSRYLAPPAARGENMHDTNWSSLPCATASRRMADMMARVATEYIRGRKRKCPEKTLHHSSVHQTPQRLHEAIVEYVKTKPTDIFVVPLGNQAKLALGYQNVMELIFEARAFMWVSVTAALCIAHVSSGTVAIATDTTVNTSDPLLPETSTNNSCTPAGRTTPRSSKESTDLLARTSTKFFGRSRRLRRRGQSGKDKRWLNSFPDPVLEKRNPRRKKKIGMEGGGGVIHSALAPGGRMKGDRHLASQGARPRDNGEGDAVLQVSRLHALKVTLRVARVKEGRRTRGTRGYLRHCPPPDPPQWATALILQRSSPKMILRGNIFFWPTCPPRWSNSPSPPSPLSLSRKCYRHCLPAESSKRCPAVANRITDAKTRVLESRDHHGEMIVGLATVRVQPRKVSNISEDRVGLSSVPEAVITERPCHLQTKHNYATTQFRKGTLVVQKLVSLPPAKSNRVRVRGGGGWAAPKHTVPL
ncbi:hypothetical protein PR048_024932 [Dryococelus australis]|uniref:Uncharacterized protein n=1 Tax=Dryococelus australis TaxID=614101 RepID=A0ABQ9GPZ2_9NEOP|nr:hypothetical protein PR048_024932 [Dryococelus australis]